jgi:hypothetical protein
MSNALIYLELAKQLNRAPTHQAGRRGPTPRRRPARHWLPKRPTAPLRWRPARVATSSPMGCTA